MARRTSESPTSCGPPPKPPRRWGSPLSPIPNEPLEPAQNRQSEPSPLAGPRMRVVWAVCDVGGRTVATFDYAPKAEAEALIAQLKAQGKGTHFLRSLKEPIARL